MKPARYQIGDVIGTRTIVAKEKRKNARGFVLVAKCLCGAITRAAPVNLEKRQCASCRPRPTPTTAKVKIGDVIGTKTVIGRACNGWLTRCECGRESNNTTATAIAEHACVACTPRIQTSGSAKRLFDKLVSRGVPRIIAVKCIKSVPCASKNRMRFRHLLAAYRAAIAETMREEQAP